MQATMGVRTPERKSSSRRLGGSGIRKLRSFGRRRSASSPLSVVPNNLSQASCSKQWNRAATCEATVLLLDGESTADESSSDVGSNAETETTVSLGSNECTQCTHDPIQAWMQDANALVTSNEMAAFASSSKDLVMVVAGTAVRVACLPITVPVQVVTNTSSLVMRTCVQVSSVVAAPFIPSSVGEDTASSRPWDGLIRSATGIVPFMFKAAGRIKDDIGATVLQLVSPPVAREGENSGSNYNVSPVRYRSSAGESSAENESFLDRLRLDYPGMELEGKECAMQGESLTGKNVSIATARSTFLLRVGDLDVSTEESEDSKSTLVHYVDLKNEQSEKYITMKALDALVEKGLALMASGASDECRTGINSDLGVQWKPEGSTEKLLRKRNKMTSQQWASHLQREVLIWSGRFQQGNHYGQQFPLFLAKGLVRISPRGILKILWDNKRTSDYNKWSLGRSDLLVIQDGNVLAADSIPVSTGTKVVESDTKVPFTNLSVTLSTLMHVRPLDQGDGYMVVSRSLNSGRAGHHLHSKVHVDPSGKNEILWGVNVLRSVPGDPYVTDFTSVSHVASTLVPGFLSKKIGTMGIEDFFNAVRSLES